MSKAICPNCGGSVDTSDRTCPYCGTALNFGAASEQESGSAKTVLSSSLKMPKFNSSAEAMDEVKRYLRADDKVNAVRVYREYFDVDMVTANTAVDQIVTDMRPPEPPPVVEATRFSDATVVEPISSKPSFSEAPQPAEASTPNRRPMIIGGSIAAVLFLCLCCCLPIAIAFYRMFGK